MSRSKTTTTPPETGMKQHIEAYRATVTAISNDAVFTGPKVTFYRMATPIDICRALIK
jgi:hypothetical protein